MRDFRFLLLMVLPAVVPAAHAASHHLLTQTQAHQLAALVARHEGIHLNDEHIEFDTMDVGRPYIPGFASFLILRESETPGPDTPLRRYAVNRRSGDVWEMTLCRHYDFPALEAMQHRMTGHAKASTQQRAAERTALGCNAPQTKQSIG